jgi:hypothetical protein
VDFGEARTSGDALPAGTVVSGILPPATDGNGGPTDLVSIGPTLPQILKGKLPLP